MQQQLTLNVTSRDGYRFGSFYHGRENAELVAFLQEIARGDSSSQCFFWGVAQSGKSHLLQSCCYLAAQQGIRARYLPLKELSTYSVDILSGLDNAHIIAIDDVDVVIGDMAWEEAIFHLINQAKELEQALLFTASENPRLLECALPDLASRLIWGASYQVYQLPDSDKAYALQARARQRGFELTDRVVEYICKHYPRDLPSLIEILDRLDAESLRAGKMITIPFVKQVIGETDDGFETVS